MIDLDKIFTKIAEGNCQYNAFQCFAEKYRIEIWVGASWRKMSKPANKDLSLNEYSHFGVWFTDYDDTELCSEIVYMALGFDFSKFSFGHAHYAFEVPKEDLIAALKKLKIISVIPDDAGDGE